MLHPRNARRIAGLDRHGETLYVIGHSRYSRGDQICGEVTGRIYGKRLAEHGLTKAFGDLRPMMCWSGYTGSNIRFAGRDLKRDGEKGPFAGHLCSALKGLGYGRMIVTGYTSAVMLPKSDQTLPTGIWLTNKSNNLIQTNDDGNRTLTQLLAMVRGTTGSLSDSNRTVWY